MSRIVSATRRRLVASAFYSFLTAIIVFGQVSCASLQAMLESSPKPSAAVKGVRLSGLSLDRVSLVFDVEISNPYTVPLPLVDATYALASVDKPFLSGTANLAGTIPAKGSKVFNLPAEVSFPSLLQTLSGVRPGAVVPYTADLSLSVDAPVVGRLALPVRHQGQVPVPAVPDVEIASVHWQTLELEQAVAVVKLNLRNNNQFAVDLNKMALDLTLGGTPVGQVQTTQPTAFDPGVQHIVEVPLSISPVKLGLGAFNMLRGKGSTYELQGVLGLGSSFGSMEIPYRKAGQAAFD